MIGLLIKKSEHIKVFAYSYMYNVIVQYCGEYRNRTDDLLTASQTL